MEFESKGTIHQENTFLAWWLVLLCHTDTHYIHVQGGNETRHFQAQGKLHSTCVVQPHLDHPELGEVARGVGVLGAERGAERVHGGHSARVRLHVELPRHRQERGLGEEVVRVVDLPVGRAEQPAD